MAYGRRRFRSRRRGYGRRFRMRFRFRPRFRAWRRRFSGGFRRGYRSFRSFFCRPRRRRRSGSRKVLLQLGRWKLTTASLLALAAVGGIGYWLYNNKKKTGKWL